MLRCLNELLNYRVAATDGDLGKVRDFYLDDREWIVRYIVVDTGKWLSGQQVLVSPVSINNCDWASRRIQFSLTKDQIEHSPSIEEDKPVSRQHEQELVEHYAWPAYWGPLPASSTGARLPAPEASRAAVAERKTTAPIAHQGDAALQSISEMTGYRIHALDDDIGHIDDFVVQDEAWIVRYVVVDTRNWLPGRRVLVSSEWISSVEWADRKVHVKLTREQIKDSPEFDPAEPINRAYEERLYDFYGRPKYWF